MIPAHTRFIDRTYLYVPTAVERSLESSNDQEQVWFDRILKWSCVIPSERRDDCQRDAVHYNRVHCIVVQYSTVRYDSQVTTVEAAPLHVRFENKVSRLTIHASTSNWRRNFPKTMTLFDSHGGGGSRLLDCLRTTGTPVCGILVCSGR